MKKVKCAGVTARDVKMTDSQKVSLLGLLAELGIRGEKAIEYIKKLLFVDSLKKATRKEAKDLINSLMKAKKEARNDRPSVK